MGSLVNFIQRLAILRQSPRNFEDSPGFELLFNLVKFSRRSIAWKDVRGSSPVFDRSEQSELREVKFRRLINTLEVIVLSKNLPLVASEEIVQRYDDMLRLEESSL